MRSRWRFPVGGSVIVGSLVVGSLVVGSLAACSAGGSPEAGSTAAPSGGVGVLGDASPSAAPSLSASASDSPLGSSSPSPQPSGVILDVVNIDNGLVKDSITVELSNPTDTDQEWQAVQLTTSGVIFGIAVGGAGDAIRYEIVNGHHCVFPANSKVGTLSPGDSLEVGLTANGAGSFTGAKLDADVCLA